MKRALIVLGVIITFALFFVFGFVISYLLNRNNSTVITKEVVSYVKEIETVEESKFDEKYSIVNYQKCNLEFPLINNQDFEEEITSNGSLSNFDDGRIWQVYDKKNPSFMPMYKDFFENELNINYLYEPGTNYSGSGYISGLITIFCGDKTKFTNEQLYTQMTTLTQEETDSLTDIFGQGEAYTRYDDKNLWGEDVIVFTNNLSFEGDTKQYLITTDKKHYLIKTYSNSTNEVIQKELDHIFNNISFN